MNPSDLVPQLPLPAWGYGRYGTTVELPGYASTRFASSLALMQQAYQANTGLLDSYSPDALERLDSFDAQASQSLPTLESLLNPFGIFTAVRELLEVDLGLAFTSHCPTRTSPGCRRSMHGRSRSRSGPSAASRGARANRAYRCP